MEEPVLGVVERMIAQADTAIEQLAKKLNDRACRYREHIRAEWDAGEYGYQSESYRDEPEDPDPEYAAYRAESDSYGDVLAQEVMGLDDALDGWKDARRILAKIRVASMLRQSEWIVLHHNESRGSFMILALDYSSRIHEGRSEGDTGLSVLVRGHDPLLENIWIPEDYTRGQLVDCSSDVTVLFDDAIARDDSVVEGAWLVAVNRAYVSIPDPNAAF